MDRKRKNEGIEELVLKSLKTEDEKEIEGGKGATRRLRHRPTSLPNDPLDFRPATPVYDAEELRFHQVADKAVQQGHWFMSAQIVYMYDKTHRIIESLGNLNNLLRSVIDAINITIQPN